MLTTCTTPLPALSPPALWQMLALVADPIRFFARQQQRYGDTFSAQVLGWRSPPVIFTGDPEFVQAIFTAPAEQFALGKVTQVFQPLTGDRSLIALDGAEHQRQRRLLMPPLHGDRLRTYGETIAAITAEVAATLPSDRPFTIRQPLADITLQIILRVVFGLTAGSRYDQLRVRIGRLLESITDPLYSSLFFFPPLQQDWGSWSPWGHFRRRMAAIDALIYAEIAARRLGDAYRDRADILSLLLAARDEQGEAMSDRELRDQLVTLLLLGHETTASSLAWALYWIHSQPEVLSQLRAELAGSGETEALTQLPYLNAVCQETLRLYPIALIAQPRVVQLPFGWGDRQFAPGTILVACIYLAHQRAATFAQPQQFQPQRFLDRKFSACEFFPFGGGSRSCIGAAFALYEMKLILATLLQASQLYLAPQAPIRPVRRGITIVPSGGLQMKIAVNR
ncbi:MAG: cytochrome P450 [Spirulinaceae cyanobacterium SM2_1_0]|nr:cytochrome P450 [Spirulinaceae cyanobacterium SM2_1_0]